MSLHPPRKLQSQFKSDPKGSLRTQYAALCFRERKGKPQILLITSRRTRRWIIPKGWPIKGLSPAAAALQEAWEEAGVQGRAVGPALGFYTYLKIAENGGPDLPCAVMVHAIRVKSLAKDYPEAAERKRQWVGRRKAAALVDEPELAHILRNFSVRALKR